MGDSEFNGPLIGGRKENVMLRNLKIGGMYLNLFIIVFANAGQPKPRPKRTATPQSNIASDAHFYEYYIVLSLRALRLY